MKNFILNLFSCVSGAFVFLPLYLTKIGIYWKLFNDWRYSSEEVFFFCFFYTIGLLVFHRKIEFFLLKLVRKDYLPAVIGCFLSIVIVFFHLSVGDVLPIIPKLVIVWSVASMQFLYFKSRYFSK